MQRGLTKLEILAITIVVLIALTLASPFLLQQQGESRRLTCERRLTKLAFAVQAYDSRHEAFPGYRNLQAVDRDGKDQPTGWAFPLLPYFDATDPTGGGQTEVIFRQYGPEGDDATRGQTPTQLLPELLCPADRLSDARRQEQPLSYVANTGQPDADVPVAGDLPPDWGANGLFFDHLRHPAQRVQMSLALLEKHDGAKQTILFSENLQAGRWTSGAEAENGFVWVPNEQDGEPSPEPLIHRINGGDLSTRESSLRFARPSSWHPGGVNIVTADGQSTFLSEKVDYLAFVRQMTSNGKEVKRAGQDELLGKPWRE